MLVYIGAMVSLVCVVLLVIFCAMNKDHRTRRGGVSVRGPGIPVMVGDPETVPLRPVIDTSNAIVVASDRSHGSRAGGGGSSMELVNQTNHSSCMAPPLAGHGGCVISSASQNMCCMGQVSQSTGSVVSSANHGPVTASEISHHLPQARHPTQRSVYCIRLTAEFSFLYGYVVSVLFRFTQYFYRM